MRPSTRTNLAHVLSKVNNTRLTCAGRRRCSLGILNYGEILELHSSPCDFSGRGKTLYQISDYLIVPQTTNSTEANKWFSASNSPTRYFGSAKVMSQVSGYSKQFLFCHNQHLEITLMKKRIFTIVIFERLKCS